MELLLGVVGIGIVCFCFPYIRCFFKRLTLRSKITGVCREKGYHLQEMHAFWFFGGKNGKNCDCVIETAKEVFAIKLFGMPRRKRILVFTEQKEYFTRIVAGVLLLLKESFDGNAKQFPEYDFVPACTMVSGDKKLRKILLVNPVPMEMMFRKERGKETKLSHFPMENIPKETAKERILSPGDELYGLEVANLSWLIKELER